MLQSATAFTLVVLLTVAMPPRTEGAPTLAVIGLDASSRGLVELVEARLLELKRYDMVERQRLGLLLKERELAELGLVAGSRVRVGTLVGADVLVLIGADPAAAGAGTRMLVCDVATGARLAQRHWPPERATAEQLADEVQAAVSRFPDGLTTILALPDFISRDFRFRHAHLQADLAELLRQSLGDQRGLAMVEVEEAKAIAAELDVAGGAVSRVLRLFVEAEYRTDEHAPGGPTITIKLTVTDGEQQVIEIDSGAIPLDEAGRFVSTVVRAKLLDAMRLKSPTDMDLNTQFAQLVEHADAFATIGEYERSAALREAALLLRPDADEQRSRLVREYVRWCDHPFEVWPEGARQDANDPFWQSLVARCRAAWRRSLNHVEYLVCNGRVDMAEGTELFYTSLHSICFIRGTMAGQLKEEEQLKKQFIRSVVPAIARLKTGPRGRGLGQLANRAVDMAKLRMDGNYFARDDLSLLADLVCFLLPEQTPVTSEMLYALRDGAHGNSGSLTAQISPEAWLEFIERLEASPRPLTRAYGRYARLRDRCLRLQDLGDESLALAKALADDVAQDPLAQLDEERLLARAVRDTTYTLEAHNRPAKRPENPPSTPRPEESFAPVEQPDGSLLCDRVRLTPLEITVASADDAAPKPLAGYRWRATGGFSSWKELVPAWEGIDAIVAHGALLFVRADGVASPVLVNSTMRMTDVVFDGHYLWAACAYDGGMYVFDRHGTMLAHVTGEQGLPETTYDMPLHVLAEGRILATGSFGVSRRGWIAVVDMVGQKPRVRVILEAAETWQDYHDYGELMNPRRCFQPDWMVGHRDQDGREWVFVNRGVASIPLVVDPESLKVSVYPSRSYGDSEYFPQRSHAEYTILSHRGLLYVANMQDYFRVFQMSSDTQRFVEQPRPVEVESGSEYSGEGCLLEHDGWLYCAGDRRWLRYHLRTKEQEILIHNHRSLPDAGSGQPWRLAVSRAFGLIAWHDEKLYRLQPP